MDRTIQNVLIPRIELYCREQLPSCMVPVGEEDEEDTNFPWLKTNIFRAIVEKIVFGPATVEGEILGATTERAEITVSGVVVYAGKFKKIGQAIDAMRPFTVEGRFGWANTDLGGSVSTIDFHKMELTPPI